MDNVDTFYKTKLLAYGFTEADISESYSQLGKLFNIPKDMGKGYYWVYGQKDLYDIKIHDFYYYEDSFFDIKTINWPECLSITYYESMSVKKSCHIGGYLPGV